ncbi:hypothetical protein [Streptomyces sp. IMTB 1903]|uniref:hypothetical protein n=1 Tax=Streptomyces sp. IMTB 1903 TaxID=1776680 RepID=UPI0007540E61|nr:hypothetical protein [Streptomyces sp. IMTB 1903]
MSDSTMGMTISAHTVRHIPYWAIVDRVVGDAGPMGTKALPKVPGLRLLFDESDAGNPREEVNDLGRRVAEELGLPYSAELRGLLGFYLADAEGQPVDMPQHLRDRIQGIADSIRGR